MVQISQFLNELSTKIVHRLLNMISMISKLNFGVGEMGFMIVLCVHFSFAIILKRKRKLVALLLLSCSLLLL